MSVRDGHYNPKAVVSSLAMFFGSGDEWTQFGHTTEERTTFGLLNRVPP